MAWANFDQNHRVLKLPKNGNILFLGAKSTSIRDCVGLSVRPSVRPPRIRPHDARLRGKRLLVTSRLLREEEEEEETDYVAIPLRRDSITSRFLCT
jgi:hypothetical protein